MHACRKKKKKDRQTDTQTHILSPEKRTNNKNRAAREMRRPQKKEKKFLFISFFNSQELTRPQNAFSAEITVRCLGVHKERGKKISLGNKKFFFIFFFCQNFQI